MVWYRLEGNRIQVRKALRDLSKDVRVVRDTEESMYLDTSTQEESWVGKVAGDFGLRFRRSDEPNYGTADCGILHTNVRVHSMRCNSCGQLRKNREMAQESQKTRDLAKESPKTRELVTAGKGKNGPVHTVVQLPGLQDFSLEGLLEVLDQQVEQSMNLAQEFDQIRSMILMYRDSNKQMSQLENNKIQALEAMRRMVKEIEQGDNVN